MFFFLEGDNRSAIDPLVLCRLTKTKLASQGPVQGQSANLVSIENWTKWRIYVNDTGNIVYGNSWAQLPLGENVRISKIILFRRRSLPRLKKCV